MAGKQLNKNLVVTLTLAVFGLMLLSAVLMLRQLQQRDPKYFVELAQQYEAQGQWQQAALLYGQAWDRSHDPEYLVLQGEVLLDDGQVVPAIARWRAALVNRPDLVDAHVHQLDVLLEWARLYGQAVDWRQVHEAAEAMLQANAQLTDSQVAMAHNANGLALIALIRHGEGSAEQGEEALRKAAELASGTVDYALDLSAYYADQGRTDDADGILTRLLGQHVSPGADASQVRTAYAKHLAERGRFEEAGRYFTESLSLAETAPKALRDAKLAYAVFLWQQWARAVRSGQDESTSEALRGRAEAILREGIAADPDDFDFYLHLAMLYKSAGRQSDVVDICDARLRRGLSRKGIAAARNQLNTFALMIHASEACVAQAVAARQAGKQDEREKWLVRAEQYVADAKGELPTHPRVLSQAGRVKLARGLDRPALEDLRAADEAYKSYGTIDWENKLILARVHLKLNEAGAAKDLLDEVIEQARRQRGNDVSFWGLYAQILFENNELNRALAITDHVLAMDSRNPDAVRLKAAIYERQGRPEDAGRMIEAATGDRVIRAILTARERALAGSVEEGIAVLRQALEKDPADPRLVSTAVRELLNQGRREEARAAIDAAQSVKPQDAGLQQLALLTREDMSPEQRDQAVLGIIAAEEDAYQRSMDLVGFYLRKNDPQRALRSIDEALGHLIGANTPAAQNATIAHHRALLKAKVSVAAVLKNAEAMEEARDAAARLDVDGVGGKSILGLYHMHRQEYDLAIRVFREVIQADPTDAASLVSLGQCLQIAGRTEEAEEAFRQALRISPNDGEAHWGLAVVAQAQGDKAAYEKELDSCRTLLPGDLRVQSAVLAQKEQDDPQTAILRREKLLAENPDDVENLARLAVLSEAADDRSRADKYYARLLELRPDDKDLTVAVGTYYRRTARPERSLDLVTRYAGSRGTAEEKANARIVIAAHYLDLQQMQEVETSLLGGADMAETLEICQSLAEFYLRALDRPDKALPWLDKAVERARTSNSPQFRKLSATRIQCLLHRKFSDVQTARRYVDELLAAFPGDPEGMLLNSEVYARTGRIERAIDALSDYLALEPNNPRALYQRALHECALGRVASAVDDLERIKRADPLALGLQPRLLLARLHQQAGRKDLWISELESLVANAPESPQAGEELVKAYVREKRLANAERMVTAQINRHGDQPDARWFFLRGLVSFESGDSAKALADFQRGAGIRKYDTESMGKVLDLCARMGKAAEGVRFYEQHTPDKPQPVTLSQYALLLAKTGEREKAVEQFRRAMSIAVADSAAAVRAVTANLRAAFPPEEGIALFQGSPGDSDMSRANQRILARFFGMASKYYEASAALQSLIETCTDNMERAALLHELGETRQIAGDAQRARRAYEEALKYDPNNWITLNNVAYLLSDELGENKLARPYAERAVAIADTPDTLDTLGWIYVGLGEFPAAIAELSRAVRLDPGSALHYYHLGEAYRRNSQFADAGDVLKSGRDFARTAENQQLVTQCQTALERVERSDASP